MRKIKRVNKGYLKTEKRRYVIGEEIVVTPTWGSESKGVLDTIGFNCLAISCTDEGDEDIRKVFFYDNIKDIRLA